MIEFKNISLRIGSTHILDEFSLKINKGEKVLIYGDSGKGKTTLIMILLGFVQPNYGKVLFEEKELCKGNVWDIRKKISYVSQDIDLHEGYVKDVMEEIFDYKSNKNIYVEEDKFMNILHYFKLSNNILTKKVESLSGGERQRLGIIISILLDKDVYLLDEVTSSLDPELKRKTVDYFIKTEKTVIVISHDLHWHNIEGIRKIKL